MAAWQAATGLEPTGILTTRQRARLTEEWRAAQAELGLEPITVAKAGLALTAPMGLVALDRVEAPFVHYAPKDGSGVRMSLISQPGDRAVLGGLYEVIQTLDIVPPDGPRGRERDGFRIRGEAAGRTTAVRAKLIGDHVVGYLLSWPPEAATAAERALGEMEATLTSVGAPLDPSAGFAPAEQSFDLVSGLEVRRPVKVGSGFWADARGAVVTAADTVAACGRITLDDAHEAQVALAEDGVAVLAPLAPLAPATAAVLAPAEGRLRSAVSVGGYPFGGVLGAATLSFGTLEDVRGLSGEAELLRLSLDAQPGQAGGPVLDAAGHVAGMLLPASEGGPVLPGDVAFALKARALLPLLEKAGIVAEQAEGGAALDAVDLTRRAAGVTVLVSCWE